MFECHQNKYKLSPFIQEDVSNVVMYALFCPTFVLLLSYVFLLFSYFLILLCFLGNTKPVQYLSVSSVGSQIKFMFLFILSPSVVTSITIPLPSSILPGLLVHPLSVCGHRYNHSPSFLHASWFIGSSSLCLWSPV